MTLRDRAFWRTVIGFLAALAVLIGFFLISNRFASGAIAFGFALLALHWFTKDNHPNRLGP